MRLTLHRPHFAVYDAVLPKAALERVHDYMVNDARLEFVNRVEHLGVWSLDDGHPLMSPVIVSDRRGGLIRVGEGAFYPYPSESALDEVLAFVLAKVDVFEPWIGAKWRSATARAFVYPQGTGLDWHDDGGEYSGAFSFYTHRAWQPQWGGELLIAQGKNAHGELVVPMPNRLVIMKGGTAHKIARVSSSAGNNHRMSVSGFFAKRDAEAFTEGVLAPL